MGNGLSIAAGILIGAVILGLAGYIYLLIRKGQAQEARWKRIADQRYKEGRTEASQILRSAVDQIADDKNRLVTMDEKDLMVETMLALSALGRRMDRLEDSQRSMTQLDSILEEVNRQAGSLSENAGLLDQQMGQIQDAAASFRSAVDGTAEAVYSLSDSAHSIERLLEQVSGQLQDLSGFTASLAELKSRLDGVLLKVNSSLKVSSENPGATLIAMDQRISAVYNQLQNLSEGLNLMAESLEGIQDTVSRTSDPGSLQRDSGSAESGN